ncbi:hypothetical protein D3C79_743810 [compost metagenome]
MGGLQRRYDAFGFGQLLEGVQRLLVGHRGVLGAADGGQVGVLGADGGEVQPRRDGVGLLDLTLLVLHQVGVHAEEDPLAAVTERRAVLAALDTVTTRLDADQTYFRVVDKVGKHADGVGAAADAGDHGVGQALFFFEALGLGLLADHLLELPHDCGEGVGAGGGAEQVVGAVVVGSPVTQRLVAGILQGG